MTRLLTPKQVAERLSVSTRTVYAWVEQGRLPVVKLSERVTRIPELAVDAIVAEAMRPATSTPPPAARTPSERLWDLLIEHRDEVLRIAGENRAGNVRVFGSVARGDATEDSDVDLLVDVEPDASLFDLAAIEVELERILGVRVDVGPAQDLRSGIRDRVMAEAIPL